MSGGGPFMGPRGGKWADAAHTIPWHSSEGRDHRQTSLLGSSDEGEKRARPLRRVRASEIEQHVKSTGGQLGRHATRTQRGSSGAHVTQHSPTLIEVRHLESFHRDHAGAHKHSDPEDRKKVERVESGKHEQLVEKLKAAGYHVQTDGAGRTLVGRRGAAPSTRKEAPKSRQQGLFKAVVAQATNRPPAGYHPAPKSKHGGWTDGQGAYWYPDQHQHGPGTHRHASGHLVHNDEVFWQEPSLDAKRNTEQRASAGAKNRVREGVAGGALEWEHHRDAGDHAVVIPDASHPGKWRYSRYDARGFGGHNTFDTKEAAAEAAAAAGFHRPAKGSLGRLSSTDAWASGSRHAKIMQLVNSVGGDAGRAAMGYYARHGKTQEALDAVLENKAALHQGKVPEALTKSFSTVVLGALAKAAKGERRTGAKYIRRVPKPGGGYRYYYAESAAARSATEGEDVRVGEKTVRVHKVHEHGIEVEDDKGKRTVTHDEWSKMLSEHYGDRFYEWAEKRARQYAGAVLKHVPAELFEELKGATDAERFEDLAKRLPEVHAKLVKAFGRAGVTPADARRAISYTLGRKGWTSGARSTLLGSMLNRETAWTVRNYRRLSGAAENLAKADGAAEVDTKHVAAAIALPRTAAAMERVVHRATAEMHHIREALKLHLTPGERPPKGEEQQAFALAPEQSAEVLARARAAHMVGQLAALAQAYPGLKDDPAMEQLRALMGGLQSVAPRTGPTTKGAQTTVYVAGDFGKPTPMVAEWALVEASEAVASHDPVSFALNEAHTVGNERAYHRDRAEQAKVINNAENLKPDLVINTNPDATNGAPIVDENGQVLGGNSRTMSMQRVYRMGGAQAAGLKDYLKGQARQFGLKPGDVEAMRQPILVRRVKPHDDAHRQLMVRQLNENFTQAMDPRTMAVAQARRLDDKALGELSSSMGPDQTLAAYLGSKGSEGFVNSLRRAGVINDQNQNAYMGKKGRLNENGRQLVENVLVGKMVGDADLLVDLPQPLVGALARSVPYMVQAEGAGKDFGIREELGHALDAYTEIKNTLGIPKGKKAQEEALTAFKRTQGMREVDGALVQEAHPALQSPKATAILNTLIRRPGPQQMAKVFRKYAEAAGAQEDGGEGLAFFEKKPSAQVFEEAFGRAEDEEARESKAAAAREAFVRKQDKPKAKDTAGFDNAMDALHEHLADWVHGGRGSGKKQLGEAYKRLGETEKAALEEANREAFVAVHGKEEAALYRRGKATDSGHEMLSLTTEKPTHGADIQAFKVSYRDVLLHHGVPDTPLNSRAFGHEKEVVLKPGAVLSPVAQPPKDPGDELPEGVEMPLGDYDGRGSAAVQRGDALTKKHSEAAQTHGRATGDRSVSSEARQLHRVAVEAHRKAAHHPSPNNVKAAEAATKATHDAEGISADTDHGAKAEEHSEAGQALYEKFKDVWTTKKQDAASAMHAASDAHRKAEGYPSRFNKLEAAKADAKVKELVAAHEKEEAEAEAQQGGFF